MKQDVRKIILFGSLTFIFIILAMLAVTPTKAVELSRKAFPNSIVDLPSGPSFSVASVPSVPADKSTKIHVSFWFPSSQSKDLANTIEGGKTISGAEMASTFGASKKQYNDLLAWLREQGYQITHTTKNRTGVQAVATVSQIEKSLDVNMMRVTINGQSSFSPDRAPSLPGSIGANVAGIDGLQTWLHAVRNSVRPKPRPVTAAMQPGSHQPPYKPSDLLLAYGGVNLIYDGAGQTIAVLIDALPHEQDVAEFWHRSGAAGDLSRLKHFSLNSSASPAVPEGEETLDAEWTSGMAPGATVKIYAAGSLQFVDLDTALDQVVEDASSDASLRQVSISLGLGESYMSRDETLREHEQFLRLAALGVNVFVASGDAGSNPDLTGHNLGGTPGPLQVEFQSSDPYVIAVGGTTLKLSASSGAITSEAAWAGSGGGISTLFSRQPWQQIKSPAGKMRVVPDVSSAADPDFGALIVFNGSSETIGGTSWSAPTWAGLCALLNEARAKAGKSSAPFLGPRLYAASNAGMFRPILVGSNGAYSAASGFNAVTGLGTPIIPQLITNLSQ